MLKKATTKKKSHKMKVKKSYRLFIKTFFFLFKISKKTNSIIFYRLK